MGAVMKGGGEREREREREIERERERERDREGTGILSHESTLFPNWKVRRPLGGPIWGLNL